MIRRISVFVFVSLAALLLPMAALAGDPSASVGEGTGAQAQVATVSSASGNLPFTGLDLVWVVLAGVALVVFGSFLRRRGTSERS